MLAAYFDESGTHGQESRVTTVAGLVGDSRVGWSRLENPWKKRLAAIPERLGKISTFHATDCANQSEDFIRFSKSDSAQLSDDLATLIAGQELMAVGASVYR